MNLNRSTVIVESQREFSVPSGILRLSPTPNGSLIPDTEALRLLPHRRRQKTIFSIRLAMRMNKDEQAVIARAGSNFSTSA